MKPHDDGAWFAPKRYGYGTGLPLAWQGWLLLGGFLALTLLLAVTLGPQRPAIYLALVLMLTLGFAILAAPRTRGGWRWRWGERD